MAHVQVHRADVELDEPMLVEGLPGVGLVGKIAADHLVESYDVVEYATLHCEGLPEIAVYHADDPTVRPPVRLYADEERNLLVLQSDVPVSPQSADEFATCVTGWLDDNGVTPIYLSGMPADKDGVPSLYGVGTGHGPDLVSDIGIDPPSEDGAISGPTGALVHHAQRVGIDSVGLIVEADGQFPDPESARVLLTEGIEPLADIEVDTDRLVEQAQEISDAKERLAQQMQQAEDESTRAQPIGMYQ